MGQKGVAQYEMGQIVGWMSQNLPHKIPPGVASNPQLKLQELIVHL